MKEKIEEKEIYDFVKDIKDLTEQKKNPTREGVEKIILSIKEKYIFETELFELKNVISTNGAMTNIKDISNNDLYNRLDSYKKIIILKFIEKYGDELFNNLVKEFELEI